MGALGVASIGWALMMISIGVAIYFGKKNKILIDNRKIIIKELKIIKQSDEYKNTSKDIKTHFEIIANASGISISDL